LSRKKQGPVLFVGSGPYRVSQETRGNIFAHSCLAALGEMGLDYVVWDNDAAGPLFWEAGRDAYVWKPFDEESAREVVAAVNPSRVWLVCAGKEVQALFARVLEEKGVGSLLPGGSDAVEAAVDWRRFRESAASAGIEVPYGGIAKSVEQAASVAGDVGFPVFLSASRTGGGGGARIAYNYEEVAAQASRLLSWSRSGEVLVVRVHEKHQQCEVHVVRDLEGGAKALAVVDAIAPLGVHIGNSVTVCPARSLAEKTLKAVKAAALALAKTAGLAGYGVFHFGIEDGTRPYAVGMRVGFTTSSYIVSLGLELDIGRAASETAFGRSVEEATRGMRAGGRVAVSSPHFDNDLFPGATETLGPYKASTGMGTGLAEGFAAAFLAAEGSAREGRKGLFEAAAETAEDRDVLPLLAAPRTDFPAHLVAAILKGHTFEEIGSASGVHRAYIEELAALVRVRQDSRRAARERKPAATAGTARGDAGASREKTTSTGAPLVLRRGAKRGKAFVICGAPARAVGIVDESDVIMRGLAKAYLDRGYRLVLVGWRSRHPLDLFFSASEVHFGECAEGLEAALASGDAKIVYVDGRNGDADELARKATAAGATLAGADPERTAALFDRKYLAGIAAGAGLTPKEWQEATGIEEAGRAAAAIGYPVLIRRRATESHFAVAYDEGQLAELASAANGTVIVERFLEDLVETAAAVLSDGRDARTVAVVEVLEEPGISTIDRAGALPPFSIPEESRRELASKAEAFVRALGFKGFVTARFGLRYNVTYYLSAAAGASREIPFAAAALGENVMAAAAAIFEGATLAEAWPRSPSAGGPVYIRQPVFSFGRFPGADTVLGANPRSTGDVVGVGTSFALAFAAARRSAARGLPAGGTVFISLRDKDKRAGTVFARQLKDLSFKIVATEGTARALRSAGVEARVVYRVSEGRPNVIDLIKNHEITLVIYTPSGRAPREDEVQIRTIAWSLGVPVITTVAEAAAAVSAIEAMKQA